MSKSFTFMTNGGKPMLNVSETDSDGIQVRNETYAFSYYFGVNGNGDGSGGQYLVPDAPESIPEDVRGYLVSMARKNDMNFRLVPSPQMTPVK
jgi:hypothetical protein